MPASMADHAAASVAPAPETQPVPVPPEAALAAAEAFKDFVQARDEAAAQGAKPSLTRKLSLLSRMSMGGSSKALGLPAFTGADFVNWLSNVPDMYAPALKGAGASASSVEIACLTIGQSLLEHRLAHSITDDYDFVNSSTVSYVFIEDELPDARREHAELSKLLENPANYSGRLTLRSESATFGRENWKPVFGVLDSTEKKLLLYKCPSAASAPLASYALQDASAPDSMAECECRSDAYCFTLKTHRVGNHKEEVVTLCADHSKKQEGWIGALINMGVTFNKDDAGADLVNVKSLYELEARALKTHETVPLSQFQNKVTLVVNISSFCGLTPRENPELVKLYDEFKDQGFEILAFPCNQFGRQEPGTDDEIEAFHRGKYGATFPIFEKTLVNGSDAHPVYRFLKSQMRDLLGSSIKWNYTKFLVDKNGRPVRRLSPTTNSSTLRDDIISLLATNSLPRR